MWIKIQSRRQFIWNWGLIGNNLLLESEVEKLSSKLYGSYWVKEEIGEVAYGLELPIEAIIHNVFHISQLKLKLSQAQRVQHFPLTLTEEQWHVS